MQFKDLQVGDVVEFVYQNQKGEIKPRKVTVESVYPTTSGLGFDFILEGTDTTCNNEHRKFFQSSVLTSVSKTKVHTPTPPVANLKTIKTPKLTWLTRLDGTVRS